MEKTAKPRESHLSDQQTPQRRDTPRTAELIHRVARVRTANEITSRIGLKPITGRSGPRLAY